MNVAIASDHHGVALKKRLIETLTRGGHHVSDLGPDTSQAVDYPDFAERVADSVAAGESDRGILICGSGIGMAIAANKVPDIRAAVCQDVDSALLSRQHNNANIICLSADPIDDLTNQLIVEAWMTADFDGGRHARRVAKIHEIERRHGSC